MDGLNFQNSHHYLENDWSYHDWIPDHDLPLREKQLLHSSSGIPSSSIPPQGTGTYFLLHPLHYGEGHPLLYGGKLE